MNSKALIGINDFSKCEGLTDEGRVKLDEINKYMNHVNEKVLPRLKGLNLNYRLSQLLELVANPELMPMGKGKDLEPMTTSDANLIRYTGRRMVLNQVEFKNLYVG